MKQLCKMKDNGSKIVYLIYVHLSSFYFTLVIKLLTRLYYNDIGSKKVFMVYIYQVYIYFLILGDTVIYKTRLLARKEVLLKVNLGHDNF